MNQEEYVISWYDFNENSNALIISKDGYLVNFFEKKFKGNLTNINIEENNKFINLKNVNIDKKFDYIIMIGSYEYSPIFFISDEPYSDLLKFLKKYLNENGKILFTINNKFGITYFAGAKSKHYKDIFQGLLDDVNYNKSNLLSKNNIISILEKSDFSNYKFYYPVPNYRNVNSIFSDDFLPDGVTSKLAYQFFYNKGSIVLFNEVEALKQICNSNLFDQFCNSYFIEVSNSKINNDVKFVSYNNLRKDKYNFMLVMHNDRVYKYSVNETGIEHINNIKRNIKTLKEYGFNVIDKVGNNWIESDFIKYETLDKKITKLLKNNNVEEACICIQEWYDYIKSKIICYEQDNKIECNIFDKFNIQIEKNFLDEMVIIKKGFIDLVFENIFVDDKNEYIFYDQEWFLENIPIEFILYRAILNLYCYNGNVISRYIECDDMLKRFKIFKFKDVFAMLEEKIQKEIIDENKYKKYLNEMPEFKSLSELKKKADDEVILNQYILNLREEKDKLNKDIENLNYEISKLNDENKRISEEKQKIDQEKKELNEFNKNLNEEIININELNKKIIEENENEKIKLNNQIFELNNQIIELNEDKNLISNRYNELELKYNAIINSRSYKFVKKIKKIIKK